MADIRSFIKSHLLEPLRYYPTVIQDTMLEIITQKLEALYDYTVKFPEILSPNQERLDILQAIADQFLFTVRDDADIQEQINILNNILYVYQRRGSIDTIENMWKYYGGTLPKNVKVVIPSYNLFRYSISKLSGTHVFQDNTLNRMGSYEIKLINNTYPIPELREFLIKELVAAGNLIYFSNELHMEILRDDPSSNPYKYDINRNYIIYTQLNVLKSTQGLTWSGYNALSITGEDHTWSGVGDIFMSILLMIHLPLDPYIINTFPISLIVIPDIDPVMYETTIEKDYAYLINLFLYCTSESNKLAIRRNLYNRQGEIITSSYPGYFILAESLLGEEVIPDEYR